MTDALQSPPAAPGGAQASRETRAAERARGGAKARARDARLDFFRGASLAIIFIAHVQGNPWNNWIPARFGFSDAADTFVFCSGFASGLAFYKVFFSHGAWTGTLRVGFRVWQVYWAHVLVTLAAAAMALAAPLLIAETRLAAQFGLDGFIANFGRTLTGLLTLQVQPGRSDILPMYLVMLAAMPVAVLLSKVWRWLPVLVCIGLWLWANAAGAGLTHSHGRWFFNPLAWQLYFFIGFFLSSGVLPAPPRHWALTAFALAFVIACLPVSDVGVRFLGDWARELRWQLLPGDHKSNLASLRVIHFFCTAYLVGVAWRGLNEHLLADWARPVVLMGQYALAIFMVGILLSMLCTALASAWRGGYPMWAALNIAGILALYVTARITRAVRRLDRAAPRLPA